MAVLATDAGGLEAAERRRRIDHSPGVDVDHAGPQHRGQAVGTGDITRPHSRGQAVLAGVRPLGNLLEGRLPRELLGELAGRLNNVALLTVLAGRTEPGDWLTRFPAATTVRLEPLSRADAATLAGAFVCDKPLTAEAEEFLVDRASGNPLYLREMVAMARARGSLVDDGNRYRLTAQADIPATLQALLAARLDALEPSQKLGLQHVAVIGEAATVEQVAHLGSTEARATLRSLVDVGLLRHGPDGRYDTVDSLLREVAYETLPHNLRGELHRQAATMVTTPEEKARHLDRAATYLADDEAVAAEAVEAFRADPGGFSAVISDLTMPEMTGLELARHVLSIRPETPIILTSGYLHSEAQQKARESGVRCVINKPFEVQELVAQVRSVLDESAG